MRLGLLLLLASCAPEVIIASDLSYANARAPFQTAPASVHVVEGDLEQPYDALGDIEVVLRQRSAFSEAPTRELGIRSLREQAGRLGAHAIIFVAFGKQGTSWWSYNELRGHGRAVRFR